MVLYVSLTIWMFLLLLIGLRKDAQTVVDLWPAKPDDVIVSRNLRVCTVLAVLTLAVLWLLTAFRAETIGNDTKIYLYYFKIFSEGGIDTTRSFELGYQFLNVLIGKCTSSPHMFLIVVATVMYLGTAIGLFADSKNILLSLCLFFCAFLSLYFSMLRQGIAMVIALFAYQALKKGKTVGSALLFFCATLFHSSAAVCFLLYFLPAKLLKKRTLIIIAALACALLSASGVLNAIGMALLPRYAHYFVSRYASSGWLAVSYEVVRNLVFYLFISIAADLGNREEKLALSSFTLLLMFSVFGYAVNLFTRAGQYFLLIAVVELPNLMFNGRIKNPRLWMFLIGTVMLASFLVTLLLRPDWNHLYPYEFWQ